MSDGMNVALFLPDAATARSVAEYEVSGLSLEYQPVRSG